MTSLGTVSPAGSMQGRVRWRRFAAIFVPAFLAIMVMFFLVAQGALGVSFAVSGQQFTVTASQLDGSGFEQWGAADLTVANPTPHIPVIVSSINSATLTNLCQSVSTPFGGPFAFLKITAGGGSTPVSAQNLVVDATNLSGSNATFTNINIGQDPTTFSNPAPGFTQGTFGQAADHVTITNLNQTAVATTAGTFTLPGLNLGFSGSSC
jgi:Family of unknown function (DUF6230)